MLIPLISSAAIAIACLVVGATATVGAVAVRRSSLLGYEVAGQVWEAEDAARAVAYAAAKAAPEFHHDLLRGPVAGLGYMVETWFAGDAANRRVAALRRAFGSRNVSQARTPRPRFGAVEADKICIRYIVPAGVAAPAIEVAS